eukprot:COSAG03_NODE_15423_length_431_cov_0.807229_1_plen_68_part_10
MSPKKPSPFVCFSISDSRYASSIPALIALRERERERDRETDRETVREAVRETVRSQRDSQRERVRESQ